MTGATTTISRRRNRWVISCTALAVALGATICHPPQPRLLWNVSASAPTGLWSVAPEVAIHRGDMVVAQLAPHWRRLAATRQYLPANVPLIKRVAATEGDRVCTFGRRLEVNGSLAAPLLSHDKMRRPLPSSRGCMFLRRGMFLLLMDHPASFDGRYFGPTLRADIVGKAEPLWVR